MKAMNSWVDEYDNWSPDHPLSSHQAQKNQEDFPEELQEQ